MSDNFHFDLTGVSLEKSMEVAFSQHRKAVAYHVDPQRVELAQRIIPGFGPRPSEIKDYDVTRPMRLVLHWTTPDKVYVKEWHPLPDMGVEDATAYVGAWLKTATFLPQPDHDGDNGKGQRVYNEAWGHVGGGYSGFVAIEPCWLMYGK